MKLFVVIRARGDAWRPALPLEAQEDWAGHASFMDALERDGFVILGGPLEGTPEFLLVVRANTPEEIADRLRGDPWTGMNLLRVNRITPWTLRLGSLP